MLRNFIRFIRRNERMALFIIAIITALAFGITPQMLSMGGKESEAVGTIYGKEISLEELRSIKIRWGYLTHFATETQWNEFLGSPPYVLAEHSGGDNKKEELTDNLAEIVAILLNLADRLNINVTPAETRIFIVSNFRNQNSTFNLQEYQRILDKLLIRDEAEFEQALQEYLCIHKLAIIRLGTQFPSLPEMFKEYVSDNEEIKIRWAEFNQPDYLNRVTTPTAEALAKFFQDNAQNYGLAEKVQIEYILAEESLVEPSPKELKDYYEKIKEVDYKIIPATPTATAAVTYKPLEEVQADVKAKWKKYEAQFKTIETINRVNELIKDTRLRQKPVDLKALAQQFSLSYGETPFFSSQQTDEISREIGNTPLLQQEIFEPQPSVNKTSSSATVDLNKISAPIKTDKGELIFRVVKRKSYTTTPPFTLALREKVLADLNELNAKQLAEKDAKDVQAAVTEAVVRESAAAKIPAPMSGTAATGEKLTPDQEKMLSDIKKGCFERIIKDRKITLHQSGFFKRTGTIAQLKNVHPGFIGQLFEIKPGDYDVKDDQVKDNQVNYYLVEVVEKRSPAGDDFDSQKPLLTQIARYTQMRDFFNKWQAELKPLIEQLKAKENPPASPAPTIPPLPEKKDSK